MVGRSQTTGAALAGASAAVLLLSMFLNWYARPEAIAGRRLPEQSFNAFEALVRSDVALVVAAVAALVLAAVVIARVAPDSPAPGLLLLGAGLFALAVVVYRGLNKPTTPFFGGPIDLELQAGWFVGLVAALLASIGGLLAYLAGPRLQLEEDELPEGDDEP